ncbi:MAG: HlyD family secretion protein [Magnetococcus sp. THC-1_WYH]
MITAPMDGRVVEVKEGLHPGLWIDTSTALAHMIDPTQTGGRFYLPEKDLPRLDRQHPSRFYPNDPSHPPVDVLLTGLSPTATRKIPWLMSSQHGGPIAARRLPHGEILSETPHHDGSFVPIANRSAPRQKIIGHVVLQGNPIRLADQMLDLVSALLIHESGF